MHSPASPLRVRPRKRTISRRRPHFSLWALMWMVTVVALLCGAAVALPTHLLMLVVRLFSLATLLFVLLGVIHGRGALQAFCIGGLVAATYSLLPELFSSGSRADVMIAELTRTLLREQDTSAIAPGVQNAILSLAGMLELVISVVSLGFFSVWVRQRLRRWQSRTS